MIVTITVEKVVVTVIVKIEQEELLVKGDGTGDKIITFNVIKGGKDIRSGDKGSCKEEDNDGDKIVENNNT